MNNESSVAFAVCGEPWPAPRPAEPGVYVVGDGGAKRVPPDIVANLGNLARRAFRDEMCRFENSPRKGWDRGPLRKTTRRLAEFYELLRGTGGHRSQCLEMETLCRRAMKLSARA